MTNMKRRFAVFHQISEPLRYRRPWSSNSGSEAPLCLCRRDIRPTSWPHGDELPDKQTGGGGGAEVSCRPTFRPRPALQNRSSPLRLPRLPLQLIWVFVYCCLLLFRSRGKKNTIFASGTHFPLMCLSNSELLRLEKKAWESNN